jgi:predicted enzyme related to lactoylglutathione lyase
MMPPDASGSYLMARVRGRDVAALSSQMSPGPTTWNTYVWVDSADDAVARAREAGGSAPGDAFDVFDSGRMAVLADPGGASICVWQAGRHRGADLVNEPGAFCWSELATADVDRSLEFYAAVFGWESEQTDFGGLPYGLVKLPGREESIAGVMPSEGPPRWITYFAVADADEAGARARELGGAVTTPPFDTSAGRICALDDPLGAPFALIRLP